MKSKVGSTGGPHRGECVNLEFIYSEIVHVFDVEKSFSMQSLFFMHLISPLVTDIGKYS